MTTQAETVTDLGGATFEAADRLAIINLMGGYGATYDTGRMDDFRALFTDASDFKFVRGGTVVGDGWGEMMPFLQARQAQAKADGSRNRHFTNSTICFTRQDKAEAEGTFYAFIVAIRAGSPPLMGVTAEYEFTAVKTGDVWKFSRLIVNIDEGA